MNRIIYIFCLCLLGPLPGQAQPLEKVFVHTDKDTYLAGEILWMKLYTVDATTGRPGMLSRSAFIEILSDEQKPVLQARIALDSGLGNASFQLPFSLHSGNYRLRAYTNWMKNFSSDTWFEKPLLILNTLRNNPPVYQAPRQTPPYDIQFFPEGGNLVANTQNNLAFRIVDSTGKSMRCKGAVLGNAGDTLAHFHTQRFGMGEFTLTPAANTRYTVIVNPDAGPTTSQQLPAADAAGYAMHVADAGDGRLRIEIHTGSQSQNQIVRLQAGAAIQETSLKPDGVTFFLNKDSLPAGVTWLMLWAGNPGSVMPVAERGWFIPPAPMKMGIRPDQQVYNRREKISLDLSTLGTDSLPLRLHGSLAVVLQDSIQSTGDADILNYLLLSAGLHGAVESPGYYFSPKNTDREQMASLLLMTQGWRRLHLSPRAQSPTQSPAYLPEYGGLLVWGHVTDRQTGAPAPGIAAWLSAPGQHFQLARSVSDRNGNIAWDMGELYGARELVVQTGNADSNYRIEISSPYADAGSKTASSMNSPSNPSQPAPAINSLTLSSTQLLRHSIGAQAQNAYRTPLYQQFTRPAPADTTAFYGRPDKRYMLDDYTRFTTMEEVIREYVKTIKLKTKKGGYELHVQSDQANQVFFDQSPLILMDGVPTTNTDNLIHLDPLKLQKIEVVAKRYFVGDALYDGIVSCNTYQGDISGFTLDGNAYTLDYDGWQLRREFYSPVYDTKEKQEGRIPDLRNTLFWSGDILTDSQGKQRLSFYSSDMPGRYIVLLQGITSDGIPASAIASFEVQ